MNRIINRGFSLIELMITVAIIGILAAIALPAYHTYTKRAHVAEGLTLSNNARIAIVDYYSTYGSYPANNLIAGIMSANSIAGNSIKSISIDTSKVTITYNTKVENNTTIELQGSLVTGAIKWTCVGGTVPRSYRPSSCR